MIYIVSGIAKAGKTFIAHRILKEKGVSVFSTDWLMMALAKAEPSHAVDADADDKVVAKALEPYLAAMIATMVANGTDQVIEGVHFLPSFAASLMKEHPGMIRFAFLGYRKVDPVRKMREILSHADDVGNAWFLSYPPAAMERLVRYLVAESDRLRLETEIYGLPYEEVEDIGKDAKGIIDRLFAER
jgi:hypothetical protein